MVSLPLSILQENLRELQINTKIIQGVQFLMALFPGAEIECFLLQAEVHILCIFGLAR